MGRTGIFILATGTVALHLLCTTAHISGPSTEQGNPQIVAVVVDNQKQPVSGALVSAYRIAPYTDTILAPSETQLIAESATDEKGLCVFDSLPAGTYSIAVRDPATNRQALHSGVEITAASRESRLTDTLILDLPGGFRGTVTRGGISGTSPLQNVNLRDGAIMVIIQEIAKSMITPGSGEYSFAGLPAGTYTVIYYATDGFYSAKRTVIVTPGAVTRIDTVVLRPLPRLLPPTEFTASYDTLAGLVHLSWQKVDYDNLRWYEVLRLDLAGPYDDTIRTVDTFAVDSVNSIPPGTVLTYVIRSVDRALNASGNTGPVEITVAGRP